MKTLLIVLLALSLAIAAYAQNTLDLIWTGYGEAGGNYYGSGVAGGDFNNDGYSDVLIGAGGWNDDQGKDYLYFGSPDFFTEPSMLFFGDSLHDAFDDDVSNVQDVSGDGVEDLLIPAYYCWTGGWAEIFYGGSDLDTIADWRVKKTALVYFEERFGVSTDSCGDVNGDGWSDLVIAGGGPTASANYFEIYYGGPDLDTIPDWHYSTTQFVNYSFYVKGLGDVNGDGFDDVMAFKPVSSPPYYPGFIFYGGSPMDTIPDLEFYPYIINGAGIGDINADGFADVAIYKWFDDNPDSIYSAVYFGSAVFDTIADVVLQGIFSPRIKSTDGFSHADVNGDGITDLICDAYAGIAQLYLGGPWFNGVPDWWYGEFYMYDGFTMFGVGDVNADSCEDLVIGLPYYDGWSYMDQGKAYLFSGNPDLIDLGAAVKPEELPSYPGCFKLDQNFPNPFNTSTGIHFELGKPSTVKMVVYDLQGKEIRELISGKQMLPGGYNIAWRGENEGNRAVSSGIYLLELTVDQYPQIIKMALVR